MVNYYLSLLSQMLYDWDRIEWWNCGREYTWPTLTSLLRIHSQTQNFGTKAWFLLLS